MCVTAVAWQAHPRWKLVAIGNRDEFHERPAAPLARWEEPQGIIAGRDLKSGGTWLGVSDQGQFVLVTNLRGYGDPDPAKRSRGELVTRLLEGTGAPRDFDQYNPFNILHVSAGDGEEGDLHFLTNRPQRVSTRLAHGIYGLSNGSLDAPWAKTLQLKSALQDWLIAGDDAREPLFEALACDKLEDIGVHPRLPSDVAVEPQETPVFIRHPLYGTRCSTIVAIDYRGAGRIIERSFDDRGAKSGEIAVEFHWPG
ncbi:NRDE family protein [Altererythrobacter sp.]|uniref:NRDE family protein n=1 Tax=Altererythrobacter sp. TaxID=1872480 RepID=UPI003D056AAE